MLMLTVQSLNCSSLTISSGLFTSDDSSGGAVFEHKLLVILEPRSMFGSSFSLFSVGNTLNEVQVVVSSSIC